MSRTYLFNYNENSTIVHIKGLKKIKEENLVCTFLCVLLFEFACTVTVLTVLSTLNLLI